MKKIIGLFKSIAVAFSIYSKIPMPPFKWDSEDMKYHLIFFPWIGVLIGALEALWFYVASYWQVGKIATGIICVVIFILVTGGLHIDGFMDTMDALHSYGDRNKKLEILKDPHVGAFSIIALAVYLMSYVAVVSEIKTYNIFLIWCLSFAASRAATGVAVMKIEKAKEDGMLKSETSNSSKAVIIPLIIQLLIVMILAFILNWKAALFLTVAQADVYIYFKSIVLKEFGGISGDTAGFYNCVFELTTAIILCLTGWMGII